MRADFQTILQINIILFILSEVAIMMHLFGFLEKVFFPIRNAALKRTELEDRLDGISYDLIHNNPEILLKNFIHDSEEDTLEQSVKQVRNVAVVKLILGLLALIILPLINVEILQLL